MWIPRQRPVSALEREPPGEHLEQDFRLADVCCALCRADPVHCLVSDRRVDQEHWLTSSRFRPKVIQFRSCRSGSIRPKPTTRYGRRAALTFVILGLDQERDQPGLLVDKVTGRAQS